jgi:hypothetical protein
VQGVEEVVVVVLVCCCGRRGGRGTLDGFRHGMFRLAVACVCVCFGGCGERTVDVCPFFL